MARRSREPDNMFEAFAGARSDYDAARDSQFRRRRTGINPMGTGADYHYRRESDYLKLLENARDLDRNDPIVGSIVDRAVDQTVSQGDDGFLLDPQTTEKEVDSYIKEKWREWAEDADLCDIACEHNFDEQTRIVFRSQQVDGDILGILTDKGSTQLNESHRVRTPTNSKLNIVNGVRLDASSRIRLGYYFTNDDIDPNQSFAKVSEATYIPTRDDDGWRQVCHVYNARRATQTRGITAFAPMFDLAAMHGDVQFAKLVQQQIVSCFAIIRQQALLADVNAQPGATGAITNRPLSDGTSRQIMGIGPGTEIIGRPGETINGFSPAVPNAEFFEHVKLILTMLGINLGMPLVLVLMDASETNFSGYRGAVEQARIGFRRNQKNLIKRWHKPVYWWRLRDWIATDPYLSEAFKRIGEQNFFKHRWTPPRWPYIQPLQDAQTDSIRGRNALSSWRRIHNERGVEWDDLHVEIVDDIEKIVRYAKKRAIAINNEFDDDDPVGWRELAPIAKAEGMTMALPAGTQPSADPENPSPTPAPKKPKPSPGGKPNA